MKFSFSHLLGIVAVATSIGFCAGAVANQAENASEGNGPPVRPSSPEGRPPPPPPDFTPPPPPPPPEGHGQARQARGSEPFGPPPIPEKRPQHEELPGDLLLLDRLLQMSTEQLARIRSVLDRLAAMEPEERDAMRQRLREFHNVTPEERRRLREKWRGMTHEERREALRELRDRDWDRFFEEDEKTASDPD